MTVDELIRELQRLPAFYRKLPVFMSSDPEGNEFYRPMEVAVGEKVAFKERSPQPKFYIRNPVIIWPGEVVDVEYQD